MGADLFGSFAESTCAALVVSGHGLLSMGLTTNLDDMMYPLVVSAAGILCCIIVSYYGVYINKVTQESDIESSLKNQLLFSSILLTPVIIAVAYLNLPSEYYMNLK